MTKGMARQALTRPAVQYGAKYVHKDIIRISAKATCKLRCAMQLARELRAFDPAHVDRFGECVSRATNRYMQATSTAVPSVTFSTPAARRALPEAISTQALAANWQSAFGMPNCISSSHVWGPLPITYRVYGCT